ncbi:MAG: hypothetical protein KJP00_14075 [Bacteroidia bacterium]|nr:hypothetical protein [Bacteroidia bacterium]
MLFLLVFSSCRFDNTSTSQQQSAPTEQGQSAEEIKFQKKDAAAYVPVSKISEIMKWDTEQVKMNLDQPISRSDKTSSSYIYNKDRLIIRLVWPEEESVQQETLQEKYSQLLRDKNHGFQFSEIKPGKEQTIYGYGTDPFGQTMYQFKKRFGNLMEIEIQFVAFSSEPDRFEHQLSEIMNLITLAGKSDK